MAQHPHLIIPANTGPVRFTSPSSGPRDRLSLPERRRGEHAQELLTQIQEIAPQAEARAEEQRTYGIDAGTGIYLAFTSEPNFDLKLESLDLARSGIELCNVKTLTDNSMQATVFVPDGQLDTFLTKIEAYQNEETTPRRPGGTAHPKNKDLVESISDIKLAALETLWTEEQIPFPAGDERRVWELWLRRDRGINHLARLRQFGPDFGLEVGEDVITFVDRLVLLVTGTANQLSGSIDILGMIAEVRAPKNTATFYAAMSPVDQRVLVDGLLDRISGPSRNTPYICLLDTGVNQAHPLLSEVIAIADLDTYKPAWGVDDRHGHGTEMAGLAAYGDLTHILQNSAPVECAHRIESVKLFNQDDPHAAQLYGAVTRESVYRAETRPDRRRSFCMSITSTDGRDRGRPSSWSAAVDGLAAGVDDGPTRLIVLSAGNTNSAGWNDYPASNMTDAIHDPAQSWNALTVGGYLKRSHSMRRSGPAIRRSRLPVTFRHAAAHRRRGRAGPSSLIL